MPHRTNHVVISNERTGYDASGILDLFVDVDLLIMDDCQEGDEIWLEHYFKENGVLSLRRVRYLKTEDTAVDTILYYKTMANEVETVGLGGDDQRIFRLPSEYEGVFERLVAEDPKSTYFPEK